MAINKSDLMTIWIWEVKMRDEPRMILKISLGYSEMVIWNKFGKKDNWFNFGYPEFKMTMR